jgi:putative acetyltransferase
MTSIREATKLDRESIREVHSCAFSEDEKRIVAALAVNLLGEETTPETIALVAEIDGEVVGHIAFSPVTVDNNEKWKGYILAPLGVKPDYQKRRVGSKLIESGKMRLSEKGVNVLFVYGDPKYYGRFGFKADTASGYSPPYGLQYPFGWQAIALNADGSGGSAAKISCVASLRDPKLW